MGGEGIFSLGLPFKKKKFSSQFREKSGEELNFLPSPLFMSVASLFFFGNITGLLCRLFIYLFIFFHSSCFAFLLCEIIVYSRSTINVCSLLSHEWWVPLIKFMVGPIIHVREIGRASCRERV